MNGAVASGMRISQQLQATADLVYTSVTYHRLSAP